MTERTWENTYELTDEQLQQLEAAESLMERMDLAGAESVLLAMLEDAADCIPVLSNLGHLYGKHLSEFETAVGYYDRVLEIEPDNAWARYSRNRNAVNNEAMDARELPPPRTMRTPHTAGARPRRTQPSPHQTPGGR